jgi:hypothetical protein
MTVSLAESRLAPDGLTGDQLRHFADHGWVVLDSVLDEDTCQRCIEAIEYTVNRLKHSTKTNPTHHRAFLKAHLYHPRFIDLYGTPGLIPAQRQLIGVRSPRLLESLATTEPPHPDRHTRGDELRDPLTWGWHRDFRPRWNILPHESDPQLINSLVVSVAFYFTPPSPDGGATALLDGSHRHEGPYDTELYKQLREQCEIVQPTAGPGTIAMFTESLLHSAVPVLGEERRYVSFAFFGAPWFGGDPELPPLFQATRILDEDVAGLFAPQVSDMQEEFD